MVSESQDYHFSCKSNCRLYAECVLLRNEYDNQITPIRTWLAHYEAVENGTEAELVAKYRGRGEKIAEFSVAVLADFGNKTKAARKREVLNLQQRVLPLQLAREALQSILDVMEAACAGPQIERAFSTDHVTTVSIRCSNEVAINAYEAAVQNDIIEPYQT